MIPEEAKLTIEYLKKMQEEYIEGFRILQHPLPEWYALDKAIETIEQTTWIPVSEKLPEERKSVLVYAPEYKNIYCAYLDGDTWFIFGGYGSYAVANVTAWMPLPEPYKAESEEV